MNRKKNAFGIKDIIIFLIWVGLIGITLWPLNALYGSAVWWSESISTFSTEFAVWGPLAGMIGMVLHVRKLLKREKLSLLLSHRILISSALIAGTLTSLCLPFFVIPQKIGLDAPNTFATAWGADWESRIKAPAQGPWLTVPYSLIVQYGSLPYTSSMFTFESDIEFWNNGVDSFKFDVHLPQLGNGPFPIIIDIHGGGWVGGDKDEQIGHLQEYFASAGYCVFSVQYGAKGEAGRSRQYSMEEILANLAAFSDYIAQPANRDHYKVNLSAVFVEGLSAGGHLSALLGVARTNVSAWNPGVHVIGAIDLYGITDIRHWDKASPLWLNETGLFNESVLIDYSIVDRFSPMTYVETLLPSNPTIVPLLVFHGAVDSEVGVSHSRDLNAICLARGLNCVYIEIPHGEHVYDEDTTSGPSQITVWAMERFMMLCRAM